MVNCYLSLIIVVPFINRDLIQLHYLVNESKQIISQCDNAGKPSKESEKVSREDACYNSIDETQTVNVKDGFMTYTKHFSTSDPIYLTASKMTMTSSPA